MKKGLLFLYILTTAGWVSSAPRLIVITVIDQLRPDQLSTNQISYQNGFKTLLEKGAIFSDSKYNLVPTVTGVGHSILVTGQPPRSSGVVGNWWWDRTLKKGIKCTFDPVHYSGPRQSRVKTLGTALKQKSQKSQVISLSMKERAAILMGGRKADLVLWFDKDTSQFISSSYYPSVPSWARALNKKIPKMGGPSSFHSEKKKGKFLRSHTADKILLQFVLEAMDAYQLGKDEYTDLLTISFSATDYVGHTFGPFGPEMEDNLKKLDVLIEKLIEKIETAVKGHEFLFILTSDHGVLPLPGSQEGEKIGAKRLKMAGFIKKLESKLQKKFPDSKGKWITYLSLPHLYFDRQKVRAKNLDWDQFLKDSVQALEELKDVSKVYNPKNWPHDDPYGEFYKQGYHEKNAGDLMIRLNQGTILRKKDTGTTHGGPYSYDTHVPLIFFGKGIKAGEHNNPIDMLDLARSLANLCGLPSFPSAQDKTLCKILRCPD